MNLPPRAKCTLATSSDYFALLRYRIKNVRSLHAGSLRRPPFSPARLIPSITLFRALRFSQRNESRYTPNLIAMCRKFLQNSSDASLAQDSKASTSRSRVVTLDSHSNAIHGCQQDCFDLNNRFFHVVMSYHRHFDCSVEVCSLLLRCASSDGSAERTSILAVEYIP